MRTPLDAQPDTEGERVGGVAGGRKQHNELSLLFFPIRRCILSHPSPNSPLSLVSKESLRVSCERARISSERTGTEGAWKRRGKGNEMEQAKSERGGAEG